eukprot:TRINITY_DN8831_c0_g1_i3.p2 TRINITY_DN8831_c0_g1~~TRINITY_DN8831_c0_g1_i3.p2  ORF type:complete len:132 (-),score=32.48 TRINITY_DN8831_c0_g1_i3:115-510(-)
MIVRFVSDDLKPKLRDKMKSFKRREGVKKVSKEECMAFGRVIRNLGSIERFFHKYMHNNTVTRNELRAMCSSMLGEEIPDLPMDVIFHLFDEDQSGDLTPNEFFDAIMTHDTSPPVAPATSIPDCLFKCFK